MRTPNSPRPIRLAVGAGAFAMAGALLLGGCSAGQVSQTASQVAAVAGANTGVGPIEVRNARIAWTGEPGAAQVYRTGADAPLELSIVNTGNQFDRLVAAQSPVAESVEITGLDGLPGGQVLVVSGEPPAPAPTPSARPSGAAGTAAPSAAPSAAPTSSRAPNSAGAAPAVTTAPAPLDARTGQIVLTGLREDLRSGLTYPLVLTFEQAGEVRVELPIATPEEPREAAEGGHE